MKPVIRSLFSTKPLFIILFCVQVFGLHTWIYGQQLHQEKILNAFFSDNREDWYGAMVEYKNSLGQPGLEDQLYLVNYYYGYIGWLLSDNEDDQADKYLNQGEELILELLKVYPNNATLLAYRGTWYAFEMDISPYKTPFLGPKSLRYINQALETDPENIQGLIERGNALYFMPSQFGGDKLETIRLFQKAIQLMEKSDDFKIDWLYWQVRARIGQAYEATNQDSLAKKQYEEILAICPDYKWVKDELLPGLTN
jgi:tetratricopeptide (TPR) repeat protein